MKAAYKIVPLMLLLAGCAQPEQNRAANETVMAPVTTPAAVEAPDVQTGVGYVGAGVEPDETRVVVKEVNPYEPIHVRVTGTGTVPTSRALSTSQKKLLSVRAAKLDAFRAIAEQVQGMKLVGNSSVANMVSVSDSFRTYVDAYLRGVNILSTSIKPDGSSEVVAEIVLDKEFYLQFKHALRETGSVMKASRQTGAQGVQGASSRPSAPPVAAPAAAPCSDDSCASSRYSSNFYNAQ